MSDKDEVITPEQWAQGVRPEGWDRELEAANEAASRVGSEEWVRRLGVPRKRWQR